MSINPTVTTAKTMSAKPNATAATLPPISSPIQRQSRTPVNPMAGTHSEFFGEKGFITATLNVDNNTKRAILYTNGSRQYIEILDEDLNTSNNKVYRLEISGDNYVGKEVQIAGEKTTHKQNGETRTFTKAEINILDLQSIKKDQFIPSSK